MKYFQWDPALLPKVFIFFIITILFVFLISARKPKIHLILAFISSTALLIVHELFLGTDAEDAYISYRYAWNLVQGNGLVFNAGEKVEGYSNFLFTMIIAGVNYLTNMDLVIAARATSFISSVAAIFLVYFLAIDLTNGNKRAAVVAMFLTACSCVFAAWGLSGMETSFFSFLVLCALLSFSKGKYLLAGVLIGLATMTRPDGILLALAFGTMLLVDLYKKEKNSIKNIVLLTIGCALFLIPWTTWRLHYYGYFLPNCIAAKKGGILESQFLYGLKYFMYFSIRILPLLPILFLTFYKTNVHWHWKTRQISTVGLIVTIFSVYIILVGGDWMPAFRFFVPVVPLISILAALGFEKIISFTEKRSRWIGSVLLLFISMYTLLQFFFFAPEIKFWKDEVSGLKEIGRWLNNSLPRGTVIATFANGGLSYEARDLYVIDMLGLTDAHIAREGKRGKHFFPGHMSHDYDYVAARKPSIIAFLGGDGFSKRIDKHIPLIQLENDYIAATFIHLKSNNPFGQYANLLVLKNDLDLIVGMLTRKGEIEYATN